MKKIILFDSEKSSLEFGALFLFVLIAVSNLAVIKFAEGYFEYFGLPLGLVNFTPQMYDYVRIALPVLIASAILTLIAVLLVKVCSSAGEFMAGRAKFNKKTLRYIKRHKKFFEHLVEALDLLLAALLTVLMIWVSYSFTTGLAKYFGEVSARNAIRLNSISNPSDNLQEIIIYKGNGEIITKKYDISKKEFLTGYEVSSVNNYRVRSINR